MITMTLSMLPAIFSRVRAILLPAGVVLMSMPWPSHAATPPDATQPLSRADAEVVLDTLKDPDKRAHFTATLEAYVHALPVAASSTKPGAASPSAAPLPSQFNLTASLQALSSRVADGAFHLADDFRIMTDLPALSGWVHTKFADESNKEILAKAMARALLTLLAVVGVEWLLRWWVKRRTGSRTDHPASRSVGFWMGSAAALIVAAVAGNTLALLLLADYPIARILGFGLVNVYIALRLLMLLVDALGTGRTQRARLQLTLLTLAIGVEWIGSEVLKQLGAAADIQDSYAKLLALIAHSVLIVMVIQSRHLVAAWLKRQTGANPTLATLGDAVAAVWPYVAVVAIACTWLVWVMDVPDAYHQMLRFVVATVTVLLVSRFLSGLLMNGLDHRLLRFADAPAVSVGARIRKYHRAVRSVLRAVIIIVTLIALTEAWGFESLNWFSEGHPGNHVGILLLKLGLLAGLGIVAWEAADVAFESRVTRLTESASLSRAIRLRTLQPIIRVALVIMLGLIVVMTALNEIGINVGPLLAGASIFGVALGFGSQKLVQDFITGIFLLVEDAVDVGDAVTVGSLSGTVEHLSIRTIRLRAGDGSVHLIPFSSVTSVTNANRGIGNAAVSVNIDPGEDIDRVSLLLAEIARGMRTEPAFSEFMRGELELWGVDKVDGTMTTIAGQIVCSDSGRWAVQREFNRRMKQRFDQEGIALSLPAQTLRIRRDPPAAAHALAHAPAESPGTA